MKILLILVNDMCLKDGQGWPEQKRRYGYAPLTLTILASLIPPELNAEVEVIDEGVEELSDDFDADLVGLSATTPNAPRAYHLAEIAKSRGATVVMGGWHATLMPDECLRHADAVVTGYAESTWPELLMDYYRKRLKRLYRDKSCRAFEHDMVIPERRLLKPRSYIIKETIEATRGCVNSCTCCVISKETESHLFKRPVADVVAEIKAMRSRKVCFLDSNLNEDVEYAKELFRALMPLKIKWFSSAMVKTIFDDEWLDLAKRSGCVGVLTGFESVNEESVRSIDKAYTHTDMYAEAIRRLHELKIGVLGCFILGLDGDDVSVFERTVDFVNVNRVDIVQYAVYTPFPGTADYYRFKKDKRIFSYDWRLYDGKHVVFHPLKMTAGELERGFQKVWKETYSTRSILERIRGVKRLSLFSLVGNLGYRHFGNKFFP